MAFYIICAQYMLEERIGRKTRKKEGRKIKEGGKDVSQSSWIQWLQVSSLIPGAKMSERVSVFLCCPEMSEELHLFSGWSISRAITGQEAGT